MGVNERTGPVVPEGAVAVGPYVPGYRAGGFLFVSGQIPLGADGEIVPGGMDKQAKACLDNMARVLAAAGATPEHVVKATIFLTDMADFAAVNAVYAEFFNDHKPARACVEVSALPKGARVEIEAIAHIPSG